MKMLISLILMTVFNVYLMTELRSRTRQLVEAGEACKVLDKSLADLQSAHERECYLMTLNSYRKGFDGAPFLEFDKEMAQKFHQPVKLNAVQPY